MALPRDFELAEHIEEAFERIGFDPAKLETRHTVSAQRSVRLLLTDWQNDQVKQWKIETKTYALTVDQQDIDVEDGVEDAMLAAILRSDIRTPVTLISREDWFLIPDIETATGMPNRMWIERSIPPVIHIYPKSENATDELLVESVMAFEDADVMSGRIDIRNAWIEAFTAGLAVKLAEKFAPDRLEEKLLLYGGPEVVGKGAYGRAKTAERDRSDTVMTVRTSRRRHR